MNPGESSQLSRRDDTQPAGYQQHHIGAGQSPSQRSELHLVQDSSFANVTLPRRPDPVAEALNPETQKIIDALDKRPGDDLTLKDVFAALGRSQYVYLDQREWVDFMIREIPQLRDQYEARYAAESVKEGWLKGVKNLIINFTIKWDLKQEYGPTLRKAQDELEALGLIKRKVHGPADSRADDVLFSMTPLGKEIFKAL